MVDQPAAMEPSSSPLSSPSDSSLCSPLSELSKTPSLPSSPVHFAAQDPARRYPSPMSTITSGTQSPLKLGEPILDDGSPIRSFIMAVSDGPPPAKRRKIAPPKVRTTEHLDLTKSSDDLTEEDDRQIDKLIAALRKKKKIVVIAGAGISVSAGIPDFRSSNGLFATARTQHKVKASGKHLFDASVYKHDSSTQSFHTMVRTMHEMTDNAQPTPFHHFLASLAEEGRLLRLYSQNIDGIDTKMPPLSTTVPLDTKDPGRTIQLHGGLQKMVCTKCGEVGVFKPELFDGPEAPLCSICEEHDQVRTAHAGKRSHGIGRLRPRFVLYNEYNPDEEAIGKVASADLKSRPDAVLVVGTSLKVPGTRRLVKELCQVARGRKDGFTAWINTDWEPKGVDFKDCWDLCVRTKCDEVAKLVALPPYDCKPGKEEDYMKARDAERRSTLEVRIAARSKQVEQAQGIITPHPSPRLSAINKPATKQAKLSFAQGANKDVKAKVTKPRARKPKQPRKPAVPKESVLQTFKATKSNSDRPAGKKHTMDGDARPPKIDTFSMASLPPLRPIRSSSTETLFKHESGETSSLGPTTPTMTSPLPKDTISPKSIPKDMRQLID